MINLDLTVERYILPIAIGCAGLALAWLAKEPSGLLVSMTAVIILGGRRASLLSAGGFAVALAAFILVLGWDSIVQPEASFRLAVFLAVGLGISGLVHLNQTASFCNRDESDARLILENMPGLGWSADPSGKFIYVSPSTLKYLGLSADDLDRIEGTNDFGWRQVVHPDDYDRVVARWLQSLKTGQPYENEHRIRRFDGGYRWFRNSGKPSRDSNGRITGWYGTSIDIHDLVTAQAALRDRERELSQLVDMVPSQVWRLAPDGEPTFYNKRLVDFLGLDVAAMDRPGMSRLAAAIAALVHPDDRASLAEALSCSLANGERFSMRFRQRRADGVYRWLESRAEPLRDDSGAILEWYGTNIDIDDLVRAQGTLRDRERELSQLVDMAPSLIWRLTPDGEPAFFNKRMVDFLRTDVADLDKPGISRLEAVLKTVHPDDVAEYRDALNRCLITGKPFSIRYRLRRADGVYRWMSSRAEPMRDQDGRIVQWYGLCHDIDDQTRLYTDIAEREARIRRLIDSDIIGIVIWDLDGTLIDANDAFLRMVQYEREDVEAGLRWFDMTPSDWQEVHACEEAEELAATGKMQAREKEYFRKDGSRVPVLIGAACFEGQSRQGVAYILDLTERKRAEAALHDRERELSQLVDMVPSYLWRITPDGAPVFFNKRLVDFLGSDVTGAYKSDRSRLDTFIEAAIHPDDALGVAEAFERCLASGERLSMKWRMRRADGVYRWMAASAEAMRDQGGRIAQWYGLCHDIDDQLQAEEALRNSKRQLEQMIEAVPFSILSFDPSKKMTYASKRYLEQAGTPAEDILDFDALARDVAHPEDYPVMFRRAQEGFTTGQPFVNRFRRRLRDGAYRWIEARAQPLRDPDGLIVQWYIASIDIEDEMRAQKAFRRRERELSQLVDALPVHIWSWTPAGKLAYVNKRSLEDLGVSKANFEDITRVAQEVVHPDDAPEVLRTSANCLKTGDAFIMRYRRRWKDGTYRWIEGRCEPLRDRDGTIVHWYQVSIEIDDEVRAQEALRQSERSLRQLVETLPAMIYCATPIGEPTYRSLQFREFLGYEPEAFGGAEKSRFDGTLDAGVHPDDVAAVKEHFAYSMSTGEPYARRHRLRRFDGEYRWVETRAAPMRNAEGIIMQWNVVCLDIDGEVRAHEELRRAQEKMAHASQAASLAELSASIAHEVNQPLAAIVATSHACRRWLSANPPNLERAKITLERIIRDANSASDVVSRIRALFSQMGMTRSAADIAEVVTEVCRLMADEVALRNIRLETEFDRSLPLILVDRIQIQQVFVNLIRNAIDALDTIDTKLIRIRAVADGDKAIRVEVRDLGAGMKDPERVFEPFFTTKQNGMGMGLAICRSIVESHDGQLWVTDNEPRGTTLAFTLPIQARTAA